jgi:hypothetical protein
MKNIYAIQFTPKFDGFSMLFKILESNKIKGTDRVYGQLFMNRDIDNNVLIIDLDLKECYIGLYNQNKLVSINEMINLINNKNMKINKVPLIFGEMHLLTAFLKDCEVDNIAVSYTLPVERNNKCYITFGNSVINETHSYSKRESSSKHIAIYNQHYNIHNKDLIIFNLPDD